MQIRYVVHHLSEVYPPLEGGLLSSIGRYSEAILKPNAAEGELPQT